MNRPGSRQAVERLFGALEQWREKEAIVFEGRAWTFGDLDRLSRRYARGLAAAGLAPGDRVAVFLETIPEAVVALLGHYRAGLVHVPVNVRYREEEVACILEDSGARAVAVAAGSEQAAILERLSRPDERRLRIVVGADNPREGELSFESLLRSKESEAREDASGSPSDADTAVLVYTSGTTGQSKGVELSFGAVVANTLTVTGLWRFGPEDRMVLALPLFHVHGLALGVHGALLHGTTALLFRRFEAPRVIEAFQAGATVFMGVPTMYVRLLEHLSSRPGDGDVLRRGRLFTAGSAPLTADDFARFEQRTGHRILERYGMSETLFTLSNPYEDRRPGTVGLPVPGCEIRVVGEEGRECADGEVGELFVRSNGIMRSYWGRPSETEASFRDGWFVTGDVARRGADGYVSILGRKSVDVIKSGGFKISAREIEDVLRRHPRIRDVAVVGTPDRVWGERIVAAVVLAGSGPALSESELARELSVFCARHLADYKRPREVRIFEELPRNVLGKVQKHRLREELRETS